MENQRLQRTLLSGAQLERVTVKQALIREFTQAGVSIRRFAAEKGIPISTLSLDLRRSRTGLSGLLDRRAISSGRKPRVEDSAIAWTVSYITLHPKASLRAAWKDLKEVALQQHWSYPTYGQLLRAFNRLPQDARTALLESSRLHFETWGIITRHQGVYPNASWQIDCSEFPVWVIDTVTGELFKAWITGIIDARTRVVLVVLVHRSVPSTADLLLALRLAILPKRDDRHPFFGIPVEVQTDNGSIFKSDDFRDALIRLNIAHQPILNNCPSANGKIERWFQTCQTQLAARLTGFTDQHEGLKNARKGAIPWPLLQGLIDRYLVDYHLAPHRELDTTPWEAWHRELGSAHGLSLDPQEVVDACMIRRDAVVQRDGVELLPGRHYHAPELAGLVGETLTLRLPPEGPGPKTTSFYKGEFLADLQCVEANPELATALREARHDRIDELRKLRRELVKAAEKIVPTSPLATSDGTDPGSPASGVDSPADHTDIRAIPKLKTDDSE